MNTVLKEIEDLIIQGNIKNCLGNLRDILSISNSELLDDVIIINSEFNKLEADKRKGILTYSEETIHSNKVNNRILSVINEIKEDEDIINKFVETNEKLNKANQELGFETHSWMRNTVIRRIAKLKEDKLVDKISILWIGKKKTSHNRMEIQILKSIGFKIRFCSKSDEAQKIIEGEKIDLVISTIRREKSQTEGLDFLKRLVNNGIKKIPFVFYINVVEKEKGVPGYAFGITNKPNELLHLIADIIDRKE